MKNFTFILAILFIAIGASGQNQAELQKKFQKAEAKFARLAERTAVLNSQPGISKMIPANEKLSLKNATATQKLDSIVSRTLNLETEIWHNDWKDEFIYNSEMRATVLLEREWAAAAQKWETSSRMEIEYNNQGLISSLSMYYLDDQSQELKLENKIDAFYDATGKLDSALHYIPEPNETWVLESKQIYHYNSAGKLVKMEFLSLEDGESETLSYIYTYNTSGNLETSSMVFYDEEEEIIFYKTFYSYDSSGKRTHSEFWSIDFFTFTLEKNSRTDYEYNASGDVTVETSSDWNKTTETWDEDEREVYTYGNINFADVVFPYFAQIFGNNDEFGGTFNKVPVESNYFEKIDGNWKNTEKTNFYYSGGTSTNIFTQEQSRIVMYPNPASDRVSFSWDSNYERLNLQIYQITGAKIIERELVSNEQVSIADLKRGIYFIKLRNGQQETYSGKLIIK
jgi:hypothetical protein